MGPTTPTTKTIRLNKANYCFDAMGLSYMAHLQRRKAVEENVHWQAWKQQKKKEQQ
jgi:hypothetical protein